MRREKTLVQGHAGLSKTALLTTTSRVVLEERTDRRGRQDARSLLVAFGSVLLVAGGFAPQTSHAQSLASGGGGGSASCADVGSVGVGGAGGSGSVTGVGSAGGTPPGCGGGGGGGAGVTGGAGGYTGSASGGAGGSSAGANGGPGGNIYSTVGGGGGGGGGAHGAIVTTSADNSNSVAGGNGGTGGSGNITNGIGGGGGGGGGYGVVVDGNGLTFANTGAVRGGNGGNGGFSYWDVGGFGGNGGMGLVFTGSGDTLVNSGSITGGAGGIPGNGVAHGLPGLGGVGIVGANLSITNSGAITGGLAGDGSMRARAIYFTGGTNTLELQAGSAITGDVVGTHADTFRLGGSTDATFDVSALGTQYTGFSTFEKTGRSTWTLTGTTFGFTPWRIDDGTLAISSDGNLGNIGSGPLTFDGGTLEFLTSFDTSRSVTLDAGGGSFDTGTNDVTLSGAIGGAGSLTKLGGGTLTLTNTNNYAGGTTISAGVLQLGNGGTPGSITGDVVDNGVLAFNRSDALTLAGNISGNGGVQQLGSGKTILTGSNSYTGDTTISAGTLQFGDGSSGGSGGNGGTGGTGGNAGIGGTGGNAGSGGTGGNAGSGGTGGNGGTGGTGGNAGTGGTGGNAGTGGSGSTGGSNSVGGNLTVTGGTLAIVTPATLNVAHDVTFADNTALSIVAGTNGPSLSADSVSIGDGVAFNLSGINDASQLDKVLIDTRTGIGGDFGAVTVGGFNGTVDYLTLSTGKSADNLQYLATYGLSWMAGNNLALGTFTLANPSDTFTVGAALTDQAANPANGWDGKSLTKAGAGTLILSADNAYTGGTTIAAGTLQLGNGGTTGSIVGDVVDNGILAFDRSDSGIFAGNISGNGVVQQLGSGTTILTGSNSYSGGTTLLGGVLSVSSDANLGAVTGVLTFNGGALQVTGTAFNGTARTINWGANGGGFDIANASNIFTLIQPLSGGGPLTKSGAGTLVLTGDNTYTDGTTIAGGVLQLGGGGTAGSITGDVTDNGILAFDRGDAVTFSGTVSGSGAVWQIGLGTTILTGDNTYTGDTTIMEGALQLGNGGTTGSIVGDIVDNGTLVFNRMNNLSFDGVISGSGSLHQIGTGRTELTGDSSGFTGSTDVETGTLAVNGKLGGALDVRSAGRLQGTGTVGDTIVSGTVAPGNSIGTINVAGDITFNPGSIYEVEVDAAGASDKIAASGIAAINGGSVKVLAGMGNYAPQTHYTIVHAEGGRTGTFTEGVTSNLAFLDPSLTYDVNNVYLTLTRNNIDFGGLGLTPNQIATGGGVESLGWGNPVYNAVLNLSAPQARSAFDALSGEIYASTKSALIEDSHFVRDAVNDRIRSAFGDLSAPPMPVMAYGEDGPRPVAPDSAGPVAWGHAFGSWGSFDGDGNAAAMDTSTGGFLAGIDGEIGSAIRLGFLTGYSHSTFDVDGRASSGSSDNYHLGLYAGGKWNALRLSGGLAYTWHDIETGRSVALPGFSDSLTGDYGAGTFQAFGEAGYKIGMGAASFEPFANLAYVSLHTDGFTEKGGVAALHVRGGTTDTTFTTLGIHLSSA
ncbi:MAG: autotransporter domain-containing protein, partial [Rhizobiaceae bacterium]